MRRAVLLGAAVLAVGSAACATILGIEDGILDTDGGGDAGPVVCTADSGLSVDGNQLFVWADKGDDSGGCAVNAPCKTIGAALAQLSGGVQTGAHIIYVSASATPYAETLHLAPGVEIQGGWLAKGTSGSVTWRSVCAPTSFDDAKIQFPNVTGANGKIVDATNFNNSATLTNLYLGPHTPANGETVYGIFATGDTTQLTLTNVWVDPGAGGAGKAGDPGANGDDGVGTCPPSDGGSGSPGDAGDPAPPTVYNPTGASAGPPTAGIDGTGGNSGANGVDGGCVSCQKCAGGCQSAGFSCGPGGLAGCAGGGGKGGGAGQTGGSSIGIFTWGSPITMNGGGIRAGNGGAGGAGGPGGPGGGGIDGTKGSVGATCNTACAAIVVCGTSQPAAGSSGSDGTAGGAGGPGGAGGGGGGGDSFGIYDGADAAITLGQGVGVTFGTGGQGQGGAPNGNAKDRAP